MEHHEKFNDKLYNNENTLMKINFSGIDAVAAQLLQIEMLHRKLIPGNLIVAAYIPAAVLCSA